MKPLARSRLHRSFTGLAALPLFGVLSPSAQAALPTLENPSRGVGTGILQTLQNYGCLLYTSRCV